MFKPDVASEPATKRRKLENAQAESLPSSQPVQSSFADVLARLKEESHESKGAWSSELDVHRCLIVACRSGGRRGQLGATRTTSH